MGSALALLGSSTGTHSPSVESAALGFLPTGFLVDLPRDFLAGAGSSAAAAPAGTQASPLSSSSLASSSLRPLRGAAFFFVFPTALLLAPPLEKYGDSFVSSPSSSSSLDAAEDLDLLAGALAAVSVSLFPPLRFLAGLSPIFIITTSSASVSTDGVTFATLSSPLLAPFFTSAGDSPTEARTDSDDLATLLERLTLRPLESSIAPAASRRTTVDRLCRRPSGACRNAPVWTQLVFFPAEQRKWKGQHSSNFSRLDCLDFHWLLRLS